MPGASVPSTLGQRLWKRRFWLTAGVALVVLVLLDAGRRPRDQVTAAGYVGAVRCYQCCGRPVVKSCGVVCRYRPTCSEYSAEAVQTHGIGYGLYLTTRRIASCNGSVPMGTYDPVPPADAPGQEP